MRVVDSAPKDAEFGASAAGLLHHRDAKDAEFGASRLHRIYLCCLELRLGYGVFRKLDFQVRSFELIRGCWPRINRGIESRLAAHTLHHYISRERLREMGIQQEATE